MNNQSPEQPFRSAFLALIGRPNSGKSTLMNTVVGEEVSIVSSLPQTTRQNIKGIYTTEQMQLVFLDTPGVHHGKHTLNEAMLHEAERAVTEGIDLLCYMVDLSRSFGEEEQAVAEIVRSAKRVPVLIIFNKTDLVEATTTTKETFFTAFPDLVTHPTLELSARKPEAKELFLAAIDRYVLPGPQFYDPEDITDATLRQIAAEYLRKQIISATREEVPHACFVEIDSYKEQKDGHKIDATIHVETTGQRGIIVGKNGSIIARIKKGAQREMTKLTGQPVSISCHIKVSPSWRDNKNFLHMMGVNYRH